MFCFWGGTTLLVVAATLVVSAAAHRAGDIEKKFKRRYHQDNAGTWAEGRPVRRWQIGDAVEDAHDTVRMQAKTVVRADTKEDVAPLRDELEAQEQDLKGKADTAKTDATNSLAGAKATKSA